MKFRVLATLSLSLLLCDASVHAQDAPSSFLDWLHHRDRTSADHRPAPLPPLPRARPSKLSPTAITPNKPEAVTSNKPEAVTSNKPEAVTSNKPEAVTPNKPEAVTSNKPEAVTSNKPPSVMPNKTSADIPD
jgi:hypothetical protein